jgi:hypothetical protein
MSLRRAPRPASTQRLTGESRLASILAVGQTLPLGVKYEHREGGELDYGAGLRKAVSAAKKRPMNPGTGKSAFPILSL